MSNKTSIKPKSSWNRWEDEDKFDIKPTVIKEWGGWYHIFHLNVSKLDLKPHYTKHYNSRQEKIDTIPIYLYAYPIAPWSTKKFLNEEYFFNGHTGVKKQIIQKFPTDYNTDEKKEKMKYYKFYYGGETLDNSDEFPDNDDIVNWVHVNQLHKGFHVKYEPPEEGARAGASNDATDEKATDKLGGRTKKRKKTRHKKARRKKTRHKKTRRKKTRRKKTRRKKARRKKKS